MSHTVILATDSPRRGCLAKFPQPLSSKDQAEVENLIDVIGRTNDNDIVYRSGEGDRDICRQVFRWDLAPYKEVFNDGLQIRRPRDSPNETFYSLEKFVKNDEMRPLDSRRESPFSFISTTASNSWIPPIPSDQGRPRTLKVYRYEIYAPGGIWMSASVGRNNSRKVQRHEEVVFVGGIAPQYVRSAQAFMLTGSPDGSTILDREDNMLLINGNFNPQSHPLRFLNIENPVCDYTGGTVPLVQRVKNESTTSNPKIINWYSTDVANRDLYLSSSFRLSRENEAYYILQNMVTQLYYDPGGENDRIVKGPSFISQMFRSLEYTPFGEHGIDAAFQLQGDEAIIFNNNLCALINYAPGTQNDKILKGPMTIPEMIPLLKGTVFENGLDSAFESKQSHEYFLCKGNVCAHIKFHPCTTEFELVRQGQISQIIPILKGSNFENNGIDAAYGSHAENEIAYLFQFHNFAQLNIDLNEHKDIIDGPYIIGSVAGVISTFAPRKNRGLDMRIDAGPLYTNPNDYDHDHVEPAGRPPSPRPPQGRPSSPPHDRPWGPPHDRPWDPPFSPPCDPPHHGPFHSPPCSPPRGPPYQDPFHGPPRSPPRWW